MEKTNQKLKILCIGNSFSQDTTAYVAEIAKAIGYEDVVIANLYIGGCPICKHDRSAVWKNSETVLYRRISASSEMAACMAGETHFSL